MKNFDHSSNFNRVLDLFSGQMTIVAENQAQIFDKA